jgi:hypothetical protein
MGLFPTSPLWVISSQGSLLYLQPLPIGNVGFYLLELCILPSPSMSDFFFLQLHWNEVFLLDSIVEICHFGPRIPEIPKIGIHHLHHFGMI